MGNQVVGRFALLLALLLAVSCNRPKEASVAKPDCRVGLVMPTTGEMAPYGAEGVLAARLALKKARSTAEHCTPVLLEQDSESLPEQANSAAADLLKPPPVQALVGEINSADTASMVSQARLADIPIIAPTASAISLTSMSDRVFRIWPNDALEVGKMEAYIQSLGIKRVGVLFIKLPYGEEMAAEFKRLYTANGGEVMLEGYSKKTVDFRPLLQRMRQFNDIYIISYVEDAALILKQAYEMRQRNQQPIRFFGTSVLDTSKLVEKAGIAAEGVTFAVVQPDESGDVSARRVFESEYRSARASASEDPVLKAAAPEASFAGYHVYDAVLLAFAGLDQSSKESAPTGRGLITYLRQMPPRTGLTGLIKFDSKGDLTSKPNVVLKHVAGGKIAPLGK